MNFLKEYWPWILAPFVLMLLGLLVLAIVANSSGGPDMTYDLI